MRILIYFFIIILSGTQLKGAFNFQWWGVKASSMGGAFVSIADDYSTPLWNPAGLNNLYITGASFIYGKPFWGIDNDFSMDNYYISVFYPYWGVGKFELIYKRLAVNNLYYEDNYILSYGKNISKYINFFSFNIFTGINIKLYHNKFILDDRTINDSLFKDGASSSTLSFDIGFLFLPFKKKNENYWCMGISIFNLNAPNMGFYSKDRINRKYNLGFSYYFNFPKILKGSQFVPSLQLSTSQNDNDFRFGFMFNIYKNIFSLRMGYNKNGITGGMGLGYSFKNFILDFDYSYVMPSNIDFFTGSHYFAITIKFPKLSLKIKNIEGGATGKRILTEK